MNKLRVLDLFSGIGGFSLGLERTGGFSTVAFCEIEPFPRKVLAKHWPGVPIYEDVRELTGERLRADGISVDVICGGFPCQDISTAGAGAGIEGERSGLWSEYARLIGELRPLYVLVENVAALLGRGLHKVLGDLAALRYDAEWHCIPAAAIGAPHRRDRIWILADTQIGVGVCGASEESREHQGQREQPSGGRGGAAPNVADTERRRLQGRNVECARKAAIIPAAFGRHCRGSEFGSPWWSEPDVGRVAHGVPNGMDRLKGLGNAVVPQIPELIGRAILESRRAA
jgi:DNA (cytosine-5)-methyltransferase 1